MRFAQRVTDSSREAPYSSLVVRCKQDGLTVEAGGVRVADFVDGMKLD